MSARDIYTEQIYKTAVIFRNKIQCVAAAQRYSPLKILNWPFEPIRVRVGAHVTSALLLLSHSQALIKLLLHKHSLISTNTQRAHEANENVINENTGHKEIIQVYIHCDGDVSVCFKQLLGHYKNKNANLLVVLEGETGDY